VEEAEIRRGVAALEELGPMPGDEPSEPKRIDSYAGVLHALEEMIRIFLSVGSKSGEGGIERLTSVTRFAGGKQRYQ